MTDALHGRVSTTLPPPTDTQTEAKCSAIRGLGKLVSQCQA